MSTVFHNCVPEKVHMALVFFSFLSLCRTFKNCQNKGSTFFINTNLQIVLNTQKLSLLKSSHQKKYLPKFSYPKNPGIENFKPKNISSIIPITSLACRCFWGARFSSLCTNSYSTEDNIPFPLFYLTNQQLWNKVLTG